MLEDRIVLSGTSPETSAPLASLLPGSQAGVVSTFQDGLTPGLSYAGTRDTMIRSSAPTTNYGSAISVSADGSPDQSALLRWDLTGIPRGALVTSASITLNVAAATGDTYEIYQLKRNWSETEATWSRASAAQTWEVAGAQGQSDRGSTVLGTMTSTSAGLKTINLNMFGLQLLRQWTINPSVNFGIVIQNYAVTHEFEFESREAYEVSFRPKLTVAWGWQTLPPNSVPTVLAGPDQTLPLGGKIVLDATVTDDGLPRPPGSLSTNWSKISGPAAVSFGNPSAVDTTAGFSASGTYVVRLTVSDGALTSSDDVTVVVGNISPVTVVNVTGVQHAQYRPTPVSDTLINLTGATFYGLEDALWQEGQPPPAQWPTHSQFSSIPESANAERFPVSIQGSAQHVTVQGGTVIGMLNHEAPWHVWKLHGDGDGVRMEGAGWYEIDGTRVDNVEDGFDPRGQVGATFHIHDVYATRIHDDAVENDDVHSGEIYNSFFQTHTFYSARGLSNPNAMVRIDNSVVELILQPFQGSTGGPTDQNTQGGYPYPDGLANGSMFKMDWDQPPNSGKVFITNTVFLIPRHASSSNLTMKFAPGTYENVTVVWLGTGAYPWPAPPGVTITTDRTVFDQAKAAFFAAHPQWAPSQPITLPDDNTSSVEAVAFSLSAAPDTSLSSSPGSATPTTAQPPLSRDADDRLEIRRARTLASANWLRSTQLSLPALALTPTNRPPAIAPASVVDWALAELMAIDAVLPAPADRAPLIRLLPATL